MKFSVIAHTHWDREWYFSHYRARVYSYIIFDEIIKFMENNKDFNCFVMDGQTSILEEYLEFHPHMKDRLKKLIKNSRILTGPWYSQTDTLVISAENIVRNLLIGMDYSKSLGHSMMIGYLPDSFGMSEQMPQIYQGFNLNYTMFRRGIADHISKDREFYWESPDGSKVFCHNIYHYGNMAYPPEDRESISLYMREMIEKLGESSKTGNIVLFNGEDQKPIRKNLLSIIDLMNDIGKNQGINVELVNPEELMEELESNNIDFDNYKGELTFGQHSRTHKSIFSTRYDLKKRNNYLESFLTNVLEPALSMAYLLGFDYEEESLNYIWKRMLDNAAHDSIGMCNSDITNMFINYRFEDAKEFSKNLLDLKLRQISMNVNSRGIFDFQIYNFLPYKASKVMDLELYLPSLNFNLKRKDDSLIDYEILSCEEVTEKIFKLSKREAGVAGNINARWLKELNKIYKVNIRVRVKELQAFGYETVRVEEIFDKEERVSEEEIINNNEKININKQNLIENDYLKLYVEDGKVKLFDKRNNKRYNDFVYIEEDGDEGDSYDYSEPSKDWKVRDLEDIITQSWSDKFYSYIKIEACMKIPYNLLERARKSSKEKLYVDLIFRISNNSSLIKTKVKILNPSIEHRLRLVINPEISSNYSIADEQFGTIKRPTILNYPNWKEEGFNEKPRTIEPMMTYCALESSEKTLQVLTQNVREYQVIGENLDRIAMTIFRSTPYLGKKDLNDRPGRESGNNSETFGTRYLNETIEAEYYINLYNYEANIFEMSKLSKEIFTPFKYYQDAEFKNNTEYLVLNQVKEKNLPEQITFFECQNNIILSTFKKAYKNEGMILRLFNPSFREKVLFKGLSLNEQYLSENYKYIKLNEVSEEKNEESNFNHCQQKTFKIQVKNIRKGEHF